MKLEKEQVSKFWKYVEKTNYCWNWKGGVNTQGYGKMRLSDKIFSSHRLSYIIHNGKIPKGKHILHHCDNPICVNPKHLYTGTHQQNMKDRTKRNNYNKGQNNWGSNLTWEVVGIIRELNDRPDLTQKVLAEEFLVSQNTISSIVNYKSWKPESFWDM